MSCTRSLTIAKSQEIDLVINWPLSVAIRSSAYTWSFASYMFTPHGTPPYTNWQITSGVLPTGLSMNPANGQITGTPTEWYDPLIYASYDAAATQRPYPITVTCQDSNGLFAQGDLILPYRMAIRLQGAITAYPANTTSPYLDNLLTPCDSTITYKFQNDADGNNSGINARIFSFTSEATGLHDTVTLRAKYESSWGKVSIAPVPAISGTTMRLVHTAGNVFPATPFSAVLSNGLAYETISVTTVTVVDATHVDLVFTRGGSPIAAVTTNLVSCTGWVLGTWAPQSYSDTQDGGAILNDDSGNGFGAFRYDDVDITFTPGQSGTPAFTDAVDSITWIVGPTGALLHGSAGTSSFTIS